MITVICLNPCIDKTVTVDGVRIGEHNRVIDNQVNIAGKGVNVAVVLSRLNEELRLIGFNYTDNGQILDKLALDEGFKAEFVRVNGEIRTNVKLYDIANNTVTELNETGGYVSADKQEELFRLYDSCQNDTQLFIMSGSLPLGCDSDTYMRLIKRTNHRCVVDCAGDNLACAIEGAPFMIKPNRAELESYMGRRLPTKEDCLSAALEIISKGVKVVLVSMGGDGAVITDGTRAYYASPLSVRVSSTVGAGDSMVAGFCFGMQNGMEFKECFAFSVAAASACVTNTATNLPEKESIMQMLPRIQITEMEI
ncbi:MAG: 1-phosphofructokinase family hexose kinase [Clostridia bacterium]|nr:1-phosphofructokinase family hexose kinase [Clostridia bacterium]